MDPSRSRGKELLLNQTKRVRDRLDFLRTLRDNVKNAIDEANSRIMTLIVKVERAAENADATQMKILAKDIRTAQQTIRNFESALDAVMSVAEEEDEFISSLPSENGSVHSDNVALPSDDLVVLDQEPAVAASYVAESTLLRSANSSPFFDIAPSQPIIAPSLLDIPPPLINITPSHSDNLTLHSANSHFDNATSQSDNLTSTDSASTGDRDDDITFVEGNHVPPGRFTFTDEKCVRFYMRYVASPDEFYVESVSHEMSATHAQLRKDMARFYENEENQKPLFRDGDSEVAEEVKGLYGVLCWRDNHSYDKKLERCLIFDSRGNNQGRGMQHFEAHIRLIDLGVTKWVRAADIWKIDRRFCKVPALLIQCRLFDTRPRDEGVATAYAHWSDEAVLKFKSLCDGDRPMTGFVMNQREPLGLMVYVLRGSEKVCINAELVTAKLAKTLTNWNRCGEISVVDRARARGEEDPCSNLNVDFLCFGPETPFLQPPVVGNLVYVDVIKWFSCCRFSVNFPKGVGDVRLPNSQATMEPIENFSRAANKMNEYYLNDTTSRLTRWPMVGQLVAAQFTDDLYYRARLMDVSPQDESAHIRYVDYGNDEWIAIERLRLLASQFVSLPYMAMECRLAFVRPLPRVSTMQQNMNLLMDFIRQTAMTMTASGGPEFMARIVDILYRPAPAGPVLSVVLESADGSTNYNNYVVAQGWAEESEM